MLKVYFILLSIVNRPLLFLDYHNQFNYLVSALPRRYMKHIFVKNNRSMARFLSYMRGKHTFVRPQKHRTKIYEKSVSYSGIKLYNSLPNSVKELKYPLYKSKLKLFFINNCLYTIDDFYVNLHKLS